MPKLYSEWKIRQDPNASRTLLVDQNLNNSNNVVIPPKLDKVTIDEYIKIT